MCFTITKSEPNNIKILTPVGREIKLPKDEIVLCRIDVRGNFIYYNNTLSRISGYTKNELLYLSYTVLIDIEMPKSIFFIIWKTLLAGYSTVAIIKQTTKSGDFHWLFTKFIVQKDEQNNIISFLIQGKQATEKSIKKIEPIYSGLSKYEKKVGIDSAVKEFCAFLKKNNIATYNDYIHNIVKEKKYSFFSNLMLY